MSTSEQPKQEAEGEPREDGTRRLGLQTPDGAQNVPLFLRDRSDGRKGDAQDEKDETGE